MVSIDALTINGTVLLIYVSDLLLLFLNHLGKHACPGRFFAGNEIKAMLAHLLLNYDVKAEVDGVRPKNVNIGPSQMPNPTAKVLFRQRQN
jgi:cytochrome P450